MQLNTPIENVFPPLNHEFAAMLVFPQINNSDKPLIDLMFCQAQPQAPAKAQTGAEISFNIGLSSHPPTHPHPSMYNSTSKKQDRATLTK